MRTTHYALPPMIFTAEILGFMTAVMLTTLAVAHLVERKGRGDTSYAPPTPPQPPKDKQ